MHKAILGISLILLFAISCDNFQNVAENKDVIDYEKKVRELEFNNKVEESEKINRLIRQLEDLDKLSDNLGCDLKNNKRNVDACRKVNRSKADLHGLFRSRLSAIHTAAGLESLNKIPARGLLYNGKLPPEGFGAYGYIVFSHNPGISFSKDFRKYKKFCDVYMNYLIQISEYSNEPNRNIMPTYWPVAEKEESRKIKYDCSYLVRNYDYTYASYILSSVGLFDKEGPLLIAFTEPYEKNKYNGDALVMDMSGFTEEGIKDGFLAWKKHITTHPDFWKDGIDSFVIRKYLAGLIEEHWAKAIDIIETVKK